MPLIIPAGYCHVIHSYSLAGDNERMAYTYGVELENPLGIGLNALAQELHLLTKNRLWDLPAPEYALEQTEVRQGTGPGTAPALGLHVERFTGTGTNAHLPQNCCLLVHKRSGLAGRRNRGRLSFVPPAEGSVSNKGTIEPASVAGFQSRFTAWLQEMKALQSVTEMVILHSTGISVAPNPVAVQVLTVDPVIGTIRKRLR